jgi:TrpR-related protein YerC/YecD
MAKRKIYEVDQKQRERMMNDFFEIVSKMKTKKDAENFFKDILTPSETLMLTRRIEIAKMLLAGFSYADIKKSLKVGDNTINYVNRWLFSGFGGYLKELQESKNRKEAEKQLPTNEWERIKKKYPAHFLIFNMIDKFKRRK